MVVENGKAPIYTLYGLANVESQLPVSKETKFEIGSITKPMTGFAVATLADKGEVDIDAPLSAFIPTNKTTERFSDEVNSITLRQLLTHTSGLPRLPPNMPLDDLSNPYAKYTVNNLYEGLAATELSAREFAYSNYAFGVVQLMLSQQLETPYSDLMKDTVFDTLGLTDTEVQLTGLSIENTAYGYNVAQTKVANWEFDSLAAAGGILMDIEDMAQWLNYLLTNHATDTVKRFKTRLSDEAPNMGYAVMLNGDNIIYHGGQTGGFGAFFQVDFERQLAIAVLTNTSKDPSIIVRKTFEQYNSAK